MDQNNRILKQKAKQQLLGNQKRTEYLVQVTIIEARNLPAKDGEGTSDPFVRITVGDLKPQVTEVKMQSNTVVFNQNFTFDGLQMNNTEFENFEILIECYDFNQFYTNELIGLHSIGLSSLYRMVHREMYQAWIPLIHPQKGLEPQGHLQINCYIVGPNDRPPVHDANEVKQEEEDDEFKDIPEDELTVEQQIERKKRKEMLNVIGVPKILGAKGHQLLINIVKAEDLQIMTMGSIDPFISVQAGGNILKTAVEEKAQKPSFKTRLMFPIFFPVNNDKIVIRLWDRRKFWSDIYVAQVPENPSPSDYFNLNYLKSVGGIMSYRWFNLYGIPYAERPSNWDKIIGNKQQIQGTQYMGRILMSMSLSESEKPQLGVQQLGAYREPQIEKFVARVDILEIQGSNDFGQDIIIKVKIGGKEFKSKWATLQTISFNNQQKKKKEDKNKKQTQKERITYSYQFKESRIQLQEEQLDFPQTFEQQPDVIVSIYDKKNQEERKAYLRLKRSCEDLNNSNPYWYALKGCQPGQSVSSFILINIQLINQYESKSIPRNPLKRNIKINYVFIASVYAGYDILPDKDFQDVEVAIDLQIGGEMINFDYNVKGNNPIWNQTKYTIVQLDEKLEFAQNLIVQFKNKQYNDGGFWNSVKNIFTGEQDNELIGENIIQSSDIRTGIQFDTQEYHDFKYNYKFYHIKNKGMSKGRILAAFHLFPLDKNAQTSNVIQNLDLKKPVNRFKKVVLEFPIIGLRYLVQKMKNPKIVIMIPQPKDRQIRDHKIKQNRQKLSEDQNDPENKQNKNILDKNYLGYWKSEITLNENQIEIQQETKFPTFCQIVTNKIDLEDESQQEEEQIQGFKSDEVKDNQTIKTDPIYIPYCDKFKNGVFQTYDNDQYDDEDEDSEEIDLYEESDKKLIFMPQMQIYVQDNVKSGLGKFFMPDKYVTSINLIKFVSWENNVIHLQEIYEYFQDCQELSDFLPYELDFQQDNGDQEQEQSSQNQDLLSQNTLSENFQDNDQNLNEQGNNEQIKPPRKSESLSNEINNLNNQKNTDKNNILENDDQDLNEASQYNQPVFKNPNIIKKQSQTRGSLKSKSDQQSISKKSSTSSMNSKISLSSQQFIRKQIQMGIKQQHSKNVKFEKVISFLKSAQDVYKNNLKLDQKRQFITNILQRIQVKDKSDEEIKAKLKKDLFSLQQQTDINEDEFINNDVFGSGIEAFNYGGREVLKENFKDLYDKDLPYLKFPLYLVSGSYSNGILGQPSSAILKGHIKITLLNNGKPSSIYPYDKYGNNNYNQTLVNYKSQMDKEKFQFNIFKQMYLDFFCQYEDLTLKTRVYILRCSNLGAQSQKLEFKQFLAGEQAKCSADPYPTVQVGDGINKGKDFIKTINNPSHKKENTLDPQFYQMYELDAQLPMDLNLQVNIQNADLIGNSLIGNFQIDLEDRLLQIKEIRSRIVLQIMENNVDDQIEDLKFSYDLKSKEQKKVLQKLKNEINSQFESIKTEVKPPVEFQELNHPDKKTCQGTAEIVIEPFFLELAQQNQPQHFEPPKPQKFEVRLIIWETQNIYINPEKKVVDIFVKVTIEGEATGTGEPVSIETDCHNGSENGNGQFNYRMIFPLQLPTQFARLRVQVYDFSVVGANDLCGETTISLSKVIYKLRTEGNYEMLPTNFSIEHPNLKGQDRGSVQIQMKIIQKEEAERNPVGNGQDEPNNDPVLVKPTEGRGISDFIKGGGFGFGRLLTIIKILIVLCGVGVTIMILFINPGILVN